MKARHAEIRRSLIEAPNRARDGFLARCTWPPWFMRTALRCAALLLLLANQAHAAEPQRVLLIHAFGHAYSPWSDMAGSFRAELVKKSPEPIDLYEVSLDTARGQNPGDE